MPEEPIDINEILAAPLPDMISQIARGVAEAQRALDEATLETHNALQANLDHPLTQIGYRVPWYFIPEVDVELKLVMFYEQTEGDKRPSIYGSPYNGKTDKSIVHRVEGTSTVKLRIVPLPSPFVDQTEEEK